MKMTRRSFFGSMASLFATGSGLFAFKHAEAFQKLGGIENFVAINYGDGTYRPMSSQNELSDLIYNIEPTDTPLLKAINQTALTSFREWHKEPLEKV